MSWQAAAWLMLGGSTVLIFLGLPVAFCFLGGIELTANVSNFTIFMVFLAVNLSVIQLSRGSQSIGRAYVLAAVVGSLTSVAMLTQFSWEVTLLSILLTLSGAGLYKIMEMDLR